ncbi:hypothetical protein B0A49_07156 [Cryomyces minteri]|uniref:Ribosome-assembly protein 3 C-terminal domain-containing protein n=1 Tax=Cryomyces minteri TaxID=331657 RepID=A0A4U0WTQ2_9PEZI|nr:hypothetical protein B0A49_07156 [Cryomyces minteri]
MESLDDAEKPMSQNPLLMTEPGWNTTKSREKAVEIAMEDWGCPAFYVGKSRVLAAFAAGKATALVVDVGASTMSVTPVTDGLVLKKGIQKSPFAGNFISSQIRLIFAQSTPPVPLVPHYMVKSKAPIDAGAPSQATFVKFDKPPAASFRRLEEERVLTEFKESIVRIWPGPGKFAQNEEAARAAPGQPFEMPDGWNNVFGAERYKAAEGLFDHKAALVDADNPAPKAEQTISAMINASLASVDVELRPHLLANIVVTGGSSLIYGFNDRLHRELEHMFPNPRIRVTAPSSISSDSSSDSEADADAQTSAPAAASSSAEPVSVADGEVRAVEVAGEEEAPVAKKAKKSRKISNAQHRTADAQEQPESPTDSATPAPARSSNQLEPDAEEAFQQFYLRQVTAEFAEDLDKIRAAGDFSDRALPVLVGALRQGTACFSAEERRRVGRAAVTAATVERGL